MRVNRIISGLAFALLYSAAAWSSPVTINFEESFPYLGPGTSYFELESQGFLFTNAPDINNASPNEGFFVESGWGENGSKGLGYCPWCELTLEKLDGSAFSLNSLFVNTIPGYGAEPFAITGYLEAGGQVEVSLTGEPGSLVLGGEWIGLTRVVFGTSGVLGDQGTGTARAIDNVTLNVVPIPGAVWLFASSLAWLGWRARRR